MYKGNSRSLLRAHKVDRILPTGGYIGSQDDPADIIKLPETMTLQEVKEEQAQLRREILRHQGDISSAKARRDTREIRRIGQVLAVMATRGSLLRERAHELVRQDRHECLWQAMTEICSADMIEQIKIRMNELLTTKT